MVILPSLGISANLKTATVVKTNITIPGIFSVSKLKHIIGWRESKGIYGIKNRYGYMGKYQFHRNTLKGLGYNKAQVRGFLIDTVMQEEAMDKLLQHNYRWLKRNGLLKYRGRVVGGVEITTEGMLAVCHLLGGLGLKHYLKHGGSMAQPIVIIRGKQVKVRKYDGLGTSIKEYLNLCNKSYTFYLIQN